MKVDIGFEALIEPFERFTVIAIQVQKLEFYCINIGLFGVCINIIFNHD